ncbi:sigma factor-like helix-turn-helix DNA-binding protein [Klebsiella sp. 141153]|uniref:sigma factor-like helix-turn-helix DNA-binding protein n=1 Tax=Klebsiella sp. 141153 TaxID=3020033 RepID=UPI002928B01D|nr:sigma factor-like helix-turn-helix DNA-binding protein [Klebsiella sp. 141153]MDU9353275.1 sigma factor-like helix-turn-helix DNA-binding protein [Klebsiella sp. 141153]
MKKIDIVVDQIQLDRALNKLFQNLVEESRLTLGEMCSAWELCEKLSTQQFMALKKNVYFADFLRAVEIYPHRGQKLSVDDEEMRKIETEVGEQPEMTSDEPVMECLQIPASYTLLDTIQLPDRFMKLIRRLKNIHLLNPDFGLGETFGELVALTVHELAAQPGIGALYIDTFKELQQWAKSAPSFEANGTPNIGIDFAKMDISQMRLSLAGVEDNYTKVLEKFSRYLKKEDMGEILQAILHTEHEQLAAIPAWGKGSIKQLLAFRDRLREEIISIQNGDIDYLALESVLIVPKRLINCPLNKLEVVILEDIESYFDKSSEMKVDIAQRRWGFVEEKNTLEEIGADYAVSRERIRQIQADVKQEFLGHMRVSQPSVWEALEPEISPDLCVKMQTLFSCFHSERDFFEFLDMVSGQTDLIAHAYPEIDKAILNTYFAENGAPIHLDDIREFIPSVCSIETPYVDNAIRHLAQQGAILLKGENVYPLQLKKAEASACVLIKHPKGLPWLDIAKLINGNNYSRSPVYEDRQDQEALNQPEYIYLSGKGTYKHTCFIDLNAAQIDDIFLDMMEYAEKNSRSVFHLSEFYRASCNMKKHDYYVIRHFVKHFGEDYGFYFDGKSQADSIGMEKGFKNITQKDVIIEAMNNSDKPLTKPEIANLLKSKSLAHASFYLDEMIERGSVVQVDRMLYTTPACAYKNIVIDDYVAALHDLLLHFGKPVEPSIFKAQLNMQFERSYSKYFYASLARLNAKANGWHRKHSLYSVTEIPFSNISSAMDTHCDSGASLQQNIDALQANIAITRETAAIAIQNWRAARFMVN